MMSKCTSPPIHYQNANDDVESIWPIVASKLLNLKRLLVLLNFHVEREKTTDTFKPILSKSYKLFGRILEIELYQYDWYWVEISIGRDSHGIVVDIGLLGQYFCLRWYR
jgi:hypothetical protein